MNPYTINPSFAGADGKASLFVTYRKQWVDIEGAPVIGNFSFHTPLGRKVGFGLNVTNASRGLLNTTSGYLTASYGISFSEAVRLRFALSGGAAFNGVDLTEMGNIASDPALQELLESNVYLIGNAGISLQVKTLNFGISVPNFFSDDYFSNEEIGYGELAPLENALLFLTNRFYFGNDKHVFEPFLLYRYSNVAPPQFEASAAVHLNHVVWFGGSYKQDFGISAFGGIKLQKTLGIGYAYSLKNTGVNEISSPTHEIQLNILFGKRDKNRSYYSFVDTSKPEIKTKRQLAIEKRRAEAAQKRAEEKRVAAAKARQEEEAQKAEEARQAEAAKQKAEQERIAEEKQLTEENAEVQQQEDSDKEDLVLQPGERVVVGRGDHLLELETGEYVVVGTFDTYKAAEAYSDELFFKGYQTRFGYITEKGNWYVYIHRDDDIEKARQVRDKYRKIGLFSSAWILSVQ